MDTETIVGVFLILGLLGILLVLVRRRTLVAAAEAEAIRQKAWQEIVDQESIAFKRMLEYTNTRGHQQTIYDADLEVRVLQEYDLKK